MKFRDGEFSTGTTGNFQSELTLAPNCVPVQGAPGSAWHWINPNRTGRRSGAKWVQNRPCLGPKLASWGANDNSTRLRFDLSSS
jgi:hypothetical protein